MERKNSNRIVMTVLFGVMMLAVASCANVGREFSQDQVSQIKIGTTTSEEVRQMFGEPWRTGIDNGDTTWTYARYNYAVFSPAKTRDLVIRFNKSDVVSSYTYNTSPGLK